MARFIGISSFAMGLLSVLFSVVSGIGVYVAIFSILLGSISLFGIEKFYSIFAVLIATISIFVVSRCHH